LLLLSFLIFVSLLLGEALSPSGLFGCSGRTTCFSFGFGFCFCFGKSSSASACFLLAFELTRS
jgi:hypothetical protein